MRMQEIIELLEFGAVITVFDESDVVLIEMEKPRVQHRIAKSQVKGLLRRGIVIVNEEGEGLKRMIFNCGRLLDVAQDVKPVECLQLVGSASASGGLEKKGDDYRQVLLPGLGPKFGEVCRGKGLRRKRRILEQMELLSDDVSPS